jgi:hypothetical protein
MSKVESRRSKVEGLLTLDFMTPYRRFAPYGAGFGLYDPVQALRSLRGRLWTLRPRTGASLPTGQALDLMTFDFMTFDNKGKEWLVYW